jgi:hypothetical protein
MKGDQLHKLALFSGAAALSAVVLSAAPATVQAASTARRPNIVFILMDNLGYGEPGVYGGGPPVAPRRLESTSSRPKGCG